MASFTTFVCCKLPVFCNWYGRTITVAWLDSHVAEQIARIVHHYGEVMARRTAKRLIDGFVLR
ncbi:hypothetical protein MicloDRAFT_00026890 [Microvirga lotononidis]|uniref:Uncharacterized protein n=1 Tax=Microvirga lotononidis TaxID=864069 RepID=I4YX59_9HYPH|nr:hypothetical protein MicloDRAFT_00026890 [Microvirga lotononidis]